MVEECYFSFAGKESFDYGIFIANVGGSPDALVSGTDTEIMSTFVAGNSSQLIYGVKENECLKFDIVLLFPKRFSFESVKEVKHWLFGHTTPQRLKFHHPDIDDYYFRCFLRHGEDWHDGDYYRAMKISVECISPYVYKENVSFTVTSSSTHTIYVDSVELSGVKPIIEFSLSSSLSAVEISNQSTNTSVRLVSSTSRPLSSEANIVINNQKKIITINNVLATDNMDFSNGHGFLLLSGGANEITGTNGVSMLFTYTPTARIGGV